MDIAHKPIGNRLIGSPIERVEDLRFLRGRGEYVDDVRRGTTLHAAILRSSVAIAAFETSIPRRRANGPASMTSLPPLRSARFPSSYCGKKRCPNSRISGGQCADGKVRYVGEPIAVVVADSAALAEDALDAIVLDIEELPAVASRTASRADTSLLYEVRGSNRAGTLTALLGDADAAFKEAAYVRRERFEVQRFTAVPMEPRGLLAEWDTAKSHLTVHGAAKVAFHNRDMLVKLLGLAEDSITMIESDVGGGFGVRASSIPRIFSFRLPRAVWAVR